MKEERKCYVRIFGRQSGLDDVRNVSDLPRFLSVFSFDQDVLTLNFSDIFQFGSLKVRLDPDKAKPSVTRGIA